MTRRVAAVIVAAACTTALATGVLLGSDLGGPSADAETTASVPTGRATVEKGDLRGTVTKSGTVRGRDTATISAGISGIVTEVPAVGALIEPRGELYRVDDTPVTYFAGSLPQWRSFEQGMPDGPDVRQLEENLADWGYLHEVPTEHFDWKTRVAIDQWQRDTGQVRTGTIERGRIWFGQGGQLVEKRSAAVGDTIGPGQEILATRSRATVVVVDLPQGSPLARIGGRVRVELPTGAKGGGGPAPGRVASVGDPTTGKEGVTVVPVTLELDDPKAAVGLGRIDVTVQFVTETRRGVLSVPVTALGARAGGGFVVDVVGADGEIRRVDATVGLFAGDRVEVSGRGLRAGQKVVVPA